MEPGWQLQNLSRIAYTIAMSVFEDIQYNMDKLRGTIVEKNGKYMYIQKGGKRTEIKAEINKETENITNPFKLLAYILEKKCAI
jgi:hypothetical protein